MEEETEKGEATKKAVVDTSHHISNLSFISTEIDGMNMQFYNGIRENAAQKPFPLNQCRFQCLYECMCMCLCAWYPWS